MIEISIWYTTAIMTTEAKLAFGMKAQKGIKKRRADNTMSPVTKPPMGVFTPLCELTADLPNEALTGMADTKEPIILHTPKAMNS